MLVISHPDAVLYIQEPIFETTVAVHITVNGLCRNGLQAEYGTFIEGFVEDLFLPESSTLRFTF
jgi:hypothetical protein